MSGGFTSLRSVHRSVRLRHYIIFSKTRRLLPIHLKLFRPPTLVTKPYALLFPPVYDLRGSWPPLLCNHNVKNMLYINVMVHTVVTAGDVLPNIPKPCVHQILTNGGGTTIFHSVTEASIYKSAAPPNYTGSPMNSVFRVLRPMNQIIKSGQTGPLTCRTSQRSWCYPPPIPTYSRTVVVSSVLFVVYLQCRNSHRRQSIESVQGIWRYPPS